ncbi:MAG: anaerobic ribonucleoside-triphosphate reductase activating protein [Candidatus Aenigmatarchaeota archaeon]
MKIKGFIKNTFIEYPGKVASMIFLPNCNFRCCFCFNPDLIFNSEKIKDIDEKEVFDYLIKNKKWIDGVVISGGEPTIHKDLPDFLKKIKEMGFLVRIYTNGSNYEMLEKLIKEKLIDSIAMDIKAPLDEEKYEKITNTKNVLENVKKSISLIMNSDIDYEFRTTVIPTIHSERDIEEIAKYIKNAKLFVLQKFLPENALDENLRKLKTQNDDEMKKLVEVAGKYVKNLMWR